MTDMSRQNFCAFQELTLKKVKIHFWFLQAKGITHL